MLLDVDFSFAATNNRSANSISGELLVLLNVFHHSISRISFRISLEIFLEFGRQGHNKRKIGPKQFTAYLIQYKHQPAPRPTPFINSADDAV